MSCSGQDHFQHSSEQLIALLRSNWIEAKSSIQNIYFFAPAVLLWFWYKWVLEKKIIFKKRRYSISKLNEPCKYCVFLIDKVFNFLSSGSEGEKKDGEQTEGSEGR